MQDVAKPQSSSESAAETIASARPHVTFEDSARWVRVRLDDEFVADSRRVRLIYEGDRPPLYYFPLEDVQSDGLKPSGRSKDTEIGRKKFWNVSTNGKTVEDAAWTFEAVADDYRFLDGYITFYWNKMDAWFEEEEEVFVHPRDPRVRVDVLESSRHVQVEIDGVVVAETRRPRLLFETGLPTRLYIPKLDVRTDLLEESETKTQCPYKGEAIYWNARVNGKLYEDIVWSYAPPFPEIPKITNFLAFFDERVDAVYVDGERQLKPESPWAQK